MRFRQCWSRCLASFCKMRGCRSRLRKESIDVEMDGQGRLGEEGEGRDGTRALTFENFLVPVCQGDVASPEEDGNHAGKPYACPELEHRLSLPV
jgi:hypothetical protein